MHIFRNIQVEAIDPHPFKGLALTVSFDKPSKELSDQILSNGCLVVLWLNAFSDVAANVPLLDRKLFFCTVDDINSNASKSGLRIKTRVKPSNPLHLLEMLKFKGKTSKEQHLMFQFRGHFFNAADAVLSALQTHTEESFPFMNSLPLAMPSGLAPRYLQDRAHRFDLRLLSTDLAANAGKLRAVQISTFEELRDHLCQTPSLNVDRTQAAAVAAGLCRDVSVIQGPPGCGKRMYLCVRAHRLLFSLGKTYVGVKIVDILLKNRNKLSDTGTNAALLNLLRENTAKLPILCITVHSPMCNVIRSLNNSSIPIMPSISS